MIRNITTMALLQLGIALAVGAATSPTEKCGAIQDAKKRLTCYDTVAKQAANDSPSAAAQALPKTPPPDTKIEVAPIADKSISIEAGLIYKSGDAKPVARTTFYLLDESLGEILRKADVKPPFDAPANADVKVRDMVYTKLVLMQYARILPVLDKIKRDQEGQRMHDFCELVTSSLLPHVVAKETTSFSGKAKFASLKPGTYYVFGMYPTQRGSVVWDLSVDATKSEANITLDQNNAVVAD